MCFGCDHGLIVCCLPRSFSVNLRSVFQVSQVRRWEAVAQH